MGLNEEAEFNMIITDLRALVHINDSLLIAVNWFNNISQTLKLKRGSGLFL